MIERQQCLLTGATGYVGGRLAPRLLADGLSVRALARTPSKLYEAPWLNDANAEVMRGDLSDLDSLLQAFDGMDVVYHLVHSMSTESDFAEEERHSAHNVAEAARRTGVRRIVYLGGLHPENSPLSEHLASRAEVGEILIDSGIETIALQAGTLIGSGSASFELIRHLSERLPVMTTPRWVHNKIQPIAIDDAMHYLRQAATVEVPESRTWDIGGPDVLEYGDMMQIYADVAGLRRRRMIVVPYLTPTVASRWVRTVTPIRGPIARPLIESLQCDAVCRNSDVDSIIPPPPGGLRGYRDAVRLTLDRVERGDDRLDWSMASAETPAAEPLPSDPEWAGEQVFTSEARTSTARDADAVLARLRSDAGDIWETVEEKPGAYLKLRSQRTMPGSAFVGYHLVPDEAGMQVITRRRFYPRGLAGLLYWRLGRVLRRLGIRVFDPFR